MTQHGIFHPYTVQEREKQRRINVALWAFAYELADDIFVGDLYFDKVCILVEQNLHINTDRPDLDEWFRKNFCAYTGSWVRSHPELDELEKLYERVRGTIDEAKNNERR